MSQRKVCVVVNSRANYGRIKSFLRAASDHPGLKLQLVVGASALLHRFGKAIDQLTDDDVAGFFVTEIPKLVKK